jgi:hypothetical protein
VVGFGVLVEVDVVKGSTGDLLHAAGDQFD